MKEYYEHRDFYLGAYLIVNGCELISHKRENGLTTFIFKREDKLLELVKAFYAMKGSVDALSYSSAIRSLKSVIHSSRSTSTSEINHNEFINETQGYV